MSADFSGTPMEEPKKKNNQTMIIIIVVVAVLLCCCCVIGVVAWQFGDQIMQALGTY